jgi:hypothetical protein
VERETEFTVVLAYQHQRGLTVLLGSICTFLAYSGMSTKLKTSCDSLRIEMYSEACPLPHPNSGKQYSSRKTAGQCTYLLETLCGKRI